MVPHPSLHHINGRRTEFFQQCAIGRDVRDCGDGTVGDGLNFVRVKAHIFEHFRARNTELSSPIHHVLCGLIA